MIKAGDCVAMLLAGGEGRRLGPLTHHMAKPAVPFGGKYRIVDFTLSNCSNSGIQAVGVLTQYKPQLLNSHISTGKAWGFDRSNGGVTMLPPVADSKGTHYYKGTADAVYQNFGFIERFSPGHLLVVSGDHIYKMDYGKMLAYHKDRQADVTIAVMEVPWKEAGRFGIMNTSDDGRVVDFEEKPQKPRNNLASMGIYIFRTEILKKQLLMDQQNNASAHDFGKNVIPQMLSTGCRIFAHDFEGYWKDVGTLESYWQANMDLLKDNPALDLDDRSWPIHTAQVIQARHFNSPKRSKCLLVNDKCTILGHADHSILFPGVKIGRDSMIRDSIIMAGATIGEGVVLERAIVGEKTVIGDGTRLTGSGEAIVVVQNDDTTCEGPSVSASEMVCVL